MRGTNVGPLWRPQMPARRICMARMQAAERAHCFSNVVLAKEDVAACQALSNSEALARPHRGDRNGMIIGTRRQ